tara:strand:+ start:62 stop:415 length:354 start_codon:yes stop_codon:yes gene_type:complete
MNNPNPESKDNIKDFIIEGEALRSLKLKEEVFHPKRNWKHYIRELLAVAFGIGMFSIALYSLILDGSTANFGLLIFGIYFTCNGAYMLHKKDIDQVHKRIDGILDLYFSDKQNHKNP